ncbi:MAG: hypothetical protein R2729_13680 [Bryobacteraceae bacterium]
MRALIFLIAIAALAQPPAAPERPKPTPETQALLDAALAAPPELGADALLQIVDLNLVPSRDQQLEIVQQAFEMAGSAKFPYHQVAAVGRARHTDSSPGIRAGALPGLSRLGLRNRAVLAAIRLDKAAALEMFERIQSGPFPALSCSDALAPSVDEYYTTHGDVVSRAMSDRDRQDERDIAAIRAATTGITNPAQIGPSARLIAAWPLAKERRAALSASFAAAVREMNADPRSFGANLTGTANAIKDLGAKLRSEGASPDGIGAAFRSYVVRHLGGPVCGEAVDAQGAAVLESVSKMLIAVDGAPLAAGKIEPRRVDGTAEFTDYWRRRREREIMASYKALRFGTEEHQAEYNKRPPRKDRMAHFLPEEIRRTPEWEAKARTFLEDIERWRKEDHPESEADVFHQSALMYRAMLNIVPPGPLAETLRGEFIVFLKSSALERESPPEWLHHPAECRRALRRRGWGENADSGADAFELGLGWGFDDRCGFEECVERGEAFFARGQRGKLRVGFLDAINVAAEGGRIVAGASDGGECAGVGLEFALVLGG